MKIAPAAVTLEQIRKARAERLPIALQSLPEKIDVLLIDAPRGLRRETVAALRAGREVLLVTTLEMTAMADVMKTRLVVEFLGLKPIGVVLNRVRGEEFELGRAEIEEIINLPMLAQSPEDANVRKALKHGAAVLEFSPRSPASKAIVELAKRLVRMRVK